MDVNLYKNNSLITVDDTNELPKSGVYQIRNVFNNKVYIGSSKNCKHRKIVHLSSLRKGTHHSVKLQRAFDKYGEDCFVFEILEYVWDTKDLLIREQYHIDNTNSVDYGYNVACIAGNMLGFKMTEQTKQKMSNSASARYSKMSKEELSLIYGTSKGRRHSSKTKEKISLGNKGKLAKRVRCIEINTIFISLVEAAAFINKSVPCIHRAVWGQQRTAGGFHWEYVDE